MSEVKIRVKDSNFDFDIPITSEGNNPISLYKSISDISNLTRRTGTHTRTFKINLTKEIVNTYDFFSEVQRLNWNNIDEDKPASIIVDGIEIESGKLMLKSYSNNNGVEVGEFIFYSDNLNWVQAGKDLTLADLSYVNNSILYTSNNISTAWSVPNNEWTFPLENRGGRKSLGCVQVEDLRPALYLRNVINLFLLKLGYVFSSTFFNSTEFSTLILNFFGNNFRHSLSTINNNRVEVGFKTSTDYADIQLGDYVTYIQSYYFNKPINIKSIPILGWLSGIDLIATIDPGNNYNANAGTQIGNVHVGIFTAPLHGLYKFSLNLDLLVYSDNTNVPGNQPIIFYVKVFDNLGNDLQPTPMYVPNNQFIGDLNDNLTLGGPQKFIGEVDVVLPSGYKAEIWCIGHTSNYPAKQFAYTIENFHLKIDLQEEIKEGAIFNLSDVVDDKIKVLDIINDVSRMFNLFWLTDEKLKKIYVEPRDTFYNSLSTAKDFTDKVVIDKEYNFGYHSDKYTRNFTFQYSNDKKDGFVAGRNDFNKTILAQYKHDLGTKFKNGETIISTKVIAPTYYLKDVDSVSSADSFYAPYCSRIWKDFTDDTPIEHIDNIKPRITNFVYGFQNGDLFNNSNLFKFKFSNEQQYRFLIPASIPITIKEGATTIVTAPINTYWHSVNGQKGLFLNNWGKTVNEIKNGQDLKCYLHMSGTAWLNFDFRNIVYIDAPIELKGYWIVEKINNYQPEKSNVIECKLLKRVNYEQEVEGTVDLENTPTSGTLSVIYKPSTPMLMTFTNAGGDVIATSMQQYNNKGIITNLLV